MSAQSDNNPLVVLGTAILVAVSTYLGSRISEQKKS
jgi:hypothetical protein